MRIKLDIELTEKQKEIDESPARFKVVKSGRRSGKTKYIAYWLAKRGLTISGKHWYVCQNLDLIRDEVWPHLCELLRDYIVNKNDTLFRMHISNGLFSSVIVCKSAERENALRGRGLRSLALDEASFVRPELWDRIIRPMLADFEAPALICSSAKRGWFTSRYNYATKNDDKDWHGFKFTIYDNPHISRDEIESIRRSTPVDVWKEEYMAEEVAHQGQVYAEFKEQAIYDPATSFLPASGWPCVVGMDWGKNADAAAVWVHVSPEGKLVVTREHVRNNWDVGRHSAVIRNYCGKLTGRVHGYVLDRSAFREEGTSGTSIADQFKGNGIYCQRSEKDVQSGINLLKQFMRCDWVHISADCQMLLSGIKEWEWNDHEPDALVAFRYAVANIVRQGLTPLANKFPEIVHAHDTTASEEIEETIRRIRPYRINRKPLKTEWSWDYEAGGPL